VKCDVVANKAHLEKGVNVKGKRRLLTLGLVVCAAVTVLATLGVAAGTTAPKSSTQETLKIGVADSPPWVLFNTKTRKYYGPSIKLFNAVAKAMGAKIQYVPTGYATAIAGLQARQFDIIGLPLFDTPERKKVIDFVLWSRSGNCYVALKENTKVNKMSDFNNSDVKMAVQTGASIETDFPKKYPNANTYSIQQTGAQPVIQEVLSGRADITDIDAPLVYKFLAVYPQLKSIPDPKTCVAKPDFSHNIGMGIRKNSDAKFRRTLRTVVKRLHATLQRDIDKYSQPKYIQLPK
jgi:polar amino acid transport system substrate-binding protein